MDGRAWATIAAAVLAAITALVAGGVLTSSERARRRLEKMASAYDKLPDGHPKRILGRLCDREALLLFLSSRSFRRGEGLELEWIDEPTADAVVEARKRWRFLVRESWFSLAAVVGFVTVFSTDSQAGDAISLITALILGVGLVVLQVKLAYYWQQGRNDALELLSGPQWAEQDDLE